MRFNLNNSSNSNSNSNNGIISSAPNSPAASARKRVNSFGNDSYVNKDERQAVSPTQQLRSQQRKRRINRKGPLSPPILSSPNHQENSGNYSSELSVAIRKKALQIMCSAKLSTSDDLLMLVCDPHLDTELRTEAVRMCGLYHYDIVQIRRKLNELCNSNSSTKRTKIDDCLRASAAVSLLRITDWQHTNAHIVLYKMLHEHNDSKTRVVALTIVGKELPELISDGYLVYLLHVAQPGSSLLEAAVRCCSGRRSTILLPLLFDKLNDPSLRELVVSGLETYEEKVVLAHARKVLSDAVKRLDMETQQYTGVETAGDAAFISGCARWMRKTTKIKSECIVVTFDILSIAVQEVKRRWPWRRKSHDVMAEMSNRNTEKIGESKQADSLSRASFLMVLEPLIHFLVDTSPEPSTLSSLQDRMIPHSTSKHDGMLREFLELIVDTIERNVEHLDVQTTGTTTTLQLVRHGALLRKNVRLLLKVCSIRFFPSTLSVDLLFESFLSPDDEHRAAAREVLENLLNSSYREVVLNVLEKWQQVDTKLLRGPSSQELQDTQDMQETQELEELSPLQVLRVLMCSPLFENVALEDVHRVMENEGTITQMLSPKGAVFARAGDIETEIFIVASGTVTVFVPEQQQVKMSEMEKRNGAKGEENNYDINVDQESGGDVATLGIGACIGERRLSALFFTGSTEEKHLNRTQLRRETSAKAASENCHLILVSLKKLASMFHSSPTILCGVLSVLLLDLRRCYIYRMAARRKRMLKMSSSASSMSSTSSLTTADSTNFRLYDRRKEFNLRLSRLSISHNDGTTETADTTATASATASATTASTTSTIIQNNPSKTVTAPTASPPPSTTRMTTARRSSATGILTSRLSLLELCICLKDVHAFRHLNNEIIKILAESGEQCWYGAGESIFCEGDASTFILVVIEGSCHLYSHTANEEHVVGRIGKGYVIGEQSLVPSSPRLVTCTVAQQSPRGEALILRFDSSSMLRLMSREKSLSEAVAAHVLTRLDKERERRQVLSDHRHHQRLQHNDKSSKGRKSSKSTDGTDGTKSIDGTNKGTKGTDGTDGTEVNEDHEDNGGRISRHWHKIRNSVVTTTTTISIPRRESRTEVRREDEGLRRRRR